MKRSRVVELTVDEASALREHLYTHDVTPSYTDPLGRALAKLEAETPVGTLQALRQVAQLGGRRVPGEPVDKLGMRAVGIATAALVQVGDICGARTPDREAVCVRDGGHTGRHLAQRGEGWD